jgi:hypothetical protein
MNQLFNPVNYFEFQAFEACNSETLQRKSFLIFPSSFSLLTFPNRAWKQKSRRGIPARGGFWLIV